MSVFRGKKLNIEIWGESHSPEIGARVSGMASFNFDENELAEFLKRRNGAKYTCSTTRKETDIPVFERGVIDNRIQEFYSFYIENKDIKTNDYSSLYGKPRPSHADYAWYLKDGTLDFSGGGRFSGRMTAPLCVVGGIIKQYLKQKGIEAEAYISEVGGIEGLSYKDRPLTIDEIIELRKGVFPSLSEKESMIGFIESKMNEGDSVGGRIECGLKLPAGVGDSLFEGLEGKISSLIYSIPGVKGVEFGLGFGFTKETGSNVNDQMMFEDGKVIFKSNNSGGINGGISNGNLVTIGVAMRPTPSIKKEQSTVDLVNKTTERIKITGRHDGCILPRALPCIESAVLIAVMDEIL